MRFSSLIVHMKSMRLPNAAIQKNVQHFKKNVIVSSKHILFGPLVLRRCTLDTVFLLKHFSGAGGNVLPYKNIYAFLANKTKLASAVFQEQHPLNMVSA